MDLIPIANTSISIFFYTTLILFCIFILLLIIHYTIQPIIPFLDTPPPSISVNQTVSLVNLSALQPSNAIINDRETFKNIPIYNYINSTISFDCYLTGEFTPTNMPKIVLYYANLANTSTTFKEYNGDSDIIPKILTLDTTDLITQFSKTNFIVYIDPVKNDMRIGIFTKDTMSPPNKYLELIEPIENVPLRKPFQISLIITSTFIEVYINKELIQTYRYKNTIVESDSTTHLYSPTTSSVKIANVQYANVPLTSVQVRNLTPVLTLPAVFL